MFCSNSKLCSALQVLASWTLNSDLFCAVQQKSNNKISSFSGVIPNSDFLAGSKLDVDSRNAVIVDKVTQSLEAYAQITVILT